MHWNIRSLNSNRSDVFFLINKYNCDVISLVETWTEPSESINLKYYKVFIFIREDGKRGIALLVKNRIQYVQKRWICQIFLEFIFFLKGGKSVIDLVICLVNFLPFIRTETLSDTHGSDHFPIIINNKFKE